MTRIPGWVWLAAALLAVVVYQHFRMASLRSEITAQQEAAFQDAIVEIHAQRAEADQARLALGAERAALLKDVAANRIALKALEGRSAVAGAATARDREAARVLVATPSCGALQASAQRLGVKVVCR